MKRGLTEFLGNGIRFYDALSSSNYVGIKSTANPTSAFYLTLPTTLPGTTQALTVSSTGVLGYTSLSGGGSVTSVDVALPTSVFSGSSGAITSNGTISFTFNNQSGNVVFASPSNGSSGAPTFRALVAADIPNLTASKITDFDTQVRTNRLDQLAVPTTNVAFNSQRISGVADPTNAQDAATKAYVDSLYNGSDRKESVRVASTANVNISSPGTSIDSVTLATGNRILLKNQTTASQNGIYIYDTSSTPLVRSTDADASAEVTSGLFVFVEEGGTNGSTGWNLTTPNPITLGTTNLTFTQIAAAADIVAGNGLVKTGNTLDVGGTGGRISVSADAIDIDTSYAGQTSIAVVGTITTGTWTGTTIAVANGGTGSTTQAGARTNLSAAGIAKGTFNNASLSGGVLTLNPGLGQQYGHFVIIDNNNKRVEADEYTHTSTTSWSADLTSFGTITGTWQFVCIA